MTGRILQDIAAALGRKLADAELLGSPATLSSLLEEGLVPDTMEVGMSAQSAAVTAIGKDILGWKIAASAEGIPIAAPLIEVFIASVDGVAVVSKTGATAVEIEICYVLSDDIPPPEPGTFYDRASLIQKISSVHLGAELIASRLEADEPVPFPLFLADRLGNHCFALGPVVDGQANAEDPRDILASNALSVTRDGALVFDGAPIHPVTDPLMPLLRYINSAGAGSALFKSGHVITTGSLCGVISISSERAIDIGKASLSTFTLSLPSHAGNDDIIAKRIVMPNRQSPGGRLSG